MVHGRRLRAHQNRVAKMRQIYGIGTGNDVTATGNEAKGDENDAKDVKIERHNRNQGVEEEEEEEGVVEEDEEGEEEWEEEAEQLYQWTQNLSEECI